MAKMLWAVLTFYFLQTGAASDISTTGGKQCLKQYKVDATSTTFQYGCTTINRNYQPYCATAVDANLVATETQDCATMTKCSAKTLHGKSCVAFSWKGQQYDANSCTYDSAFFDQPWCATEPVSNDAYLGAAGIFNWDYCTCNAADTKNVMCSEPTIDITNVADGWRESGVIPDKLAVQPKEPMLINFPSSGITAGVGAQLETQSMQSAPVPIFQCDTNKIYTYLVEDNGIEAGFKYWHYLVYNIKNCDINTGTVAFDWIPGFNFKLKDGALDTETTDLNPHLHLMYEQPGEITMTESQIGCNDKIVSERIKMTHDQLQAKYSLVGPVAGSVVMVPYSGKSTNEILCHYSKCLGSPWPAALPGVNDGAACQKNVWVVSGGYNGVKASNVVDLLLLDETPPRVVTATNYPVRAEGTFGTQLDDDRALVCGGLDADDSSGYNDCYIYSISTDSWMPSILKYDEDARTFPWGVDLPTRNEWFITGGSRSFWSTVVISTQILDKKSNRFRKGPDMPGPINDHCLTRLSDTKVLLIGGRYDTGFSGNVYTMDLADANPVWSEVASLSAPRIGFACGTFQNAQGQQMVYAAGGYFTGFALTDIVEVYNVATNSWTTVAPLPQGIAFSMSASDKYIIGGVGSTEVDTVYEFQPATMTFQLLPVTLSEKRSAPAVTVVNR